MSNPFFKNQGPFTIIEILKLLEVNEMETRVIRNNKLKNITFLKQLV